MANVAKKPKKQRVVKTWVGLLVLLIVTGFTGYLIHKAMPKADSSACAPQVEVPTSEVRDLTGALKLVCLDARVSLSIDDDKGSLVGQEAAIVFVSGSYTITSGNRTEKEFYEANLPSTLVQVTDQNGRRDAAPVFVGALPYSIVDGSLDANNPAKYKVKVTGKLSVDCAPVEQEIEITSLQPRALFFILNCKTRIPNNGGGPPGGWGM